MSFKRAYRAVRSHEVIRRERALLQASLGAAYDVRLTGLGAGETDIKAGSNPSPDITIYREGHPIAEVEVTGTRYPFYAIASKGLWPRPDKLRYALRHPYTERILYVHLLLAVSPRPLAPLAAGSDSHKVPDTRASIGADGHIILKAQGTLRQHTAPNLENRVERPHPPHPQPSRR